MSVSQPSMLRYYRILTFSPQAVKPITYVGGQYCNPAIYLFSLDTPDTVITYTAAADEGFKEME